jgi:cytochrome c-type biogenesis protein CcmH
MLFWVLVTAIALAVILFLARALLVGGRKKEHPASYDLVVYRDQLKEVDRDLARGVLSDEDAGRLKIEISRKVLAADAQIAAAGDGSHTQGPKAFIGAAILVLVLGGGGIFAYGQLGRPGFPDMGLKSRVSDAAEAREARPTQAEAESALPPIPMNSGDSEYVQELMEKLREVVLARPDDVEGLQLLASNEANLGNHRAAYEAQARLITILGDLASPEEFVTLGELLILGANGYVSPEAEAALTQALRLEPEHPVARYYMGLMMAQTGRPDVAFRVWRGLLNEGPPSAPWIGAIRSQIVELSVWAGVEYELPPVETLAGPSAADVAAAGDMTADEQKAFIESMVAQLSERLAVEGGSAAEWSRLISSLGILGDLEQASAIWNEAQVVFAGSPDGLEIVRAGARRAGVAE